MAAARPSLTTLGPLPFHLGLSRATMAAKPSSATVRAETPPTPWPAVGTAVWIQSGSRLVTREIVPWAALPKALPASHTLPPALASCGVAMPRNVRGVPICCRSES